MLLSRERDLFASELVSLADIRLLHDLSCIICTLGRDALGDLWGLSTEPNIATARWLLFFEEKITVDGDSEVGAKFQRYICKERPPRYRP